MLTMRLLRALSDYCPDVTIGTSGTSHQPVQGRYGMSVEVNCLPGYRVDDGLSYVTTCQQNLTWSRVENCTGKSFSIS